MLKRIEIKISLLIFFYGLFSNNFLILENKEKAFIGIFLFSIPLIFSLTKASKLVKIYAIWFGVFLILQSILFALPNNPDFKTLKPNLYKKVKIDAGAVHGIEGIQTIITDSKGFRTTKDIDYSYKAKNKYRIFTLGGSTTEQIAIDQNHISSALLQEHLDQKFPDRDFEVINTGLSGIRSINHLATLKKIVNYHPDMVIFLMGINDWNNHIMTNFNDTNKPLSNYQKFISAITAITNKLAFDIAWNAFYAPIRDMVKFKILKINHEKELEIQDILKNKGSLFITDKREFKPDDVLISYKTTLDQINKICDENKIKCIFLTQANGYKKLSSKNYKKNFWMTPPGQQYTLNFNSLIHISKLYNDYMRNFAKKNNKILCDIDAGIPPSLNYMYDDCHFNTNGAKKVSELLFQCIENKL